MIIKDLVFWYCSEKQNYTGEDIIDMCFDVCSKMERIIRHLEKANKCEYKWHVREQKIISKSNSLKGLSEFRYRTFIEKVTPRENQRHVQTVQHLGPFTKGVINTPSGKSKTRNSRQRSERTNTRMPIGTHLETGCLSENWR